MMNHQINIGFETEVADENSVRELIRTCAERVLTSEQVDFDAEIDVTVVDADAIREMNAEYRNKDAVTDVLSFLNTGFQVLFHSPPGVLFTFPSQYYALSVTK